MIWLAKLHMMPLVRDKKPKNVLHCFEENKQNLKRPSHDKQMLANLWWKTQITVCERHNNMLANCWRLIELVSIHVNFFPTCCCVVRTHQLLANTSWPTFVCRVKAAQQPSINTLAYI